MRLPPSPGPLPPVTGYADRWSVAPDGRIGFHVHTDGGRDFDCQFVRLVWADPNPAGPGYREEDVACDANGRHRGAAQGIRIGSWAETGNIALGRLPEGLEAELLVWPTTPAKPRQTLLAWTGANQSWTLMLDGAAGLALEIGPQRWTLGHPMLARAWYRVRLHFSPADRRITLEQRPFEAHPFAGDAARLDVAWSEPVTDWGTGVLRMAASSDPASHFNGRLEAPHLASGDRLLHAWDFAREIESERIVDTGPAAAHGRVFNLPTRAVKGAFWSGRTQEWTQAPEDYAAIHFHDTDLADCGWSQSLALTVPEGWRSGLYAARLRCDGVEDYIPFCVRPARPTAPLALLVPTFTYQVYGNYGRPGRMAQLRERARAWGALEALPDGYPLVGLSSYHDHSDGSGVAITAQRRPLLDNRPKLAAWPDEKGSGCTGFVCETYITHWLEHLGQDYDVVTDHDLHAEGLDLLEPYRAVVTGQHPEYLSQRMMDAAEGYLAGGGRLLYLGGNGFYWRAEPHATAQAIEVRRAEGGIRLWVAEPGEYYHAFGGGFGGLWRRIGRPPNRLVGVGFSAQGSGYRGYPYRFTAAILDPRLAFLRQGIEAESEPGATFGDGGWMGGGAAGYEVDSADPALGTPAHALVLARGAVPATDTYIPVHEERLSLATRRPVEDLLSADMTFFETDAGGAVFSVGSMTYVGSLRWNGYDNVVARLTANVLRRFLDPQPFPGSDPKCPEDGE